MAKTFFFFLIKTQNLTINLHAFNTYKNIITNYGILCNYNTLLNKLKKSRINKPKLTK